MTTTIQICRRPRALSLLDSVAQLNGRKELPAMQEVCIFENGGSLPNASTVSSWKRHLSDALNLELLKGTDDKANAHSLQITEMGLSVLRCFFEVAQEFNQVNMTQYYNFLRAKVNK